MPLWIFIDIVQSWKNDYNKNNMSWDELVENCDRKMGGLGIFESDQLFGRKEYDAIWVKLQYIENKRNEFEYNGL